MSRNPSIEGFRSFFIKKELASVWLEYSQRGVFMKEEYCVHCGQICTEKEIYNLLWTDFVTGLPSSCPELIQYLKECRLYVNAPVEEDEDL